MGIYTEVTYKQYGPQWRENLFYSHILSLPLFLPFAPSMWSCFSRMTRTAPLQLSTPISLVNTLAAQTPSQVAYLWMNVFTQYACIRGVNLLAAVSSALTVTIVLNIRKLVSLLLSIWLFGNELAMGTLVGAMVVFSAGGLYSMGGKKKHQPKGEEKNGKPK